MENWINQISHDLPPGSLIFEKDPKVNLKPLLYFFLLYFLYAGPVHTQTPYRQRGQRCFPSFFKINTVGCQCWFCIRTVWRTKPPTWLGQGYKNTTRIVFNKYALSYLLLMFAGFFVKHVSSDIKPTVLYPRLCRVISKQQNTKYK
jgi:hypothetical protein